jgi:hypothetical protein
MNAVLMLLHLSLPKTSCEINNLSGHSRNPEAGGGLSVGFHRGRSPAIKSHSIEWPESRLRVISVVLTVGRSLPVFPLEADIFRVGRHVSNVPED